MGLSKYSYKYLKLGLEVLISIATLDITLDTTSHEPPSTICFPSASTQLLRSTRSYRMPQHFIVTFHNNCNSNSGSLLGPY